MSRAIARPRDGEQGGLHEHRSSTDASRDEERCDGRTARWPRRVRL